MFSLLLTMLATYNKALSMERQLSRRRKRPLGRSSRKKPVVVMPHDSCARIPLILLPLEGEGRGLLPSPPPPPTRSYRPLDGLWGMEKDF